MRCSTITGVSGAAALISVSVGIRCSANWAAVHPPITRTHWPAGVRSACSRSIANACARLPTPSHLSSAPKWLPPRMMWRWLSISPGTTRRFSASTTRVPGPTCRITSASAPIAPIEPAVGCAGSSVVMRALRSTSSAVPLSVMVSLLSVVVCPPGTSAWVRDHHARSAWSCTDP